LCPLLSSFLIFLTVGFNILIYLFKKPNLSFITSLYVFSLYFINFCPYFHFFQTTCFKFGLSLFF
jgi:hypothetical protein